MDIWIALVTGPLVVILTASTSLLGWLYQQERQRRQEIEKQLSEKKYQTYSKAINQAMDTPVVIQKAFLGDMDTYHRYVDDLMAIGRDMLLYASDEAFGAYVNWVEKVYVTLNFDQLSKMSPKEQIEAGQAVQPALEMLLVEIRRDMGNPKTKIHAKDATRIAPAEILKIHLLLKKGEEQQTTRKQLP